MIAVQIVESANFGGKDKVSLFLQLNSFIRTCLALIGESAWIYEFQAVCLETICIGDKFIYLWYETLDFMCFGDNIWKKKVSIIEDGVLPFLDRENPSSDYSFETNIMVIEQ